MRENDYEYETTMLAYYAKKQLNLEKNKIKPAFENHEIEFIFKKLHEEINELKSEFFNVHNYNLKHIFHEIGDCAAVLTGLIAWVNANIKKVK